MSWSNTDHGSLPKKLWNVKRSESSYYENVNPINIFPKKNDSHHKQVVYSPGVQLMPKLGYK